MGKSEVSIPYVVPEVCSDQTFVPQLPATCSGLTLATPAELALIRQCAPIVQMRAGTTRIGYAPFEGPVDVRRFIARFGGPVARMVNARGTGFLVSRDLLVTAEHVAENVPPNTATARFAEELVSYVPPGFGCSFTTFTTTCLPGVSELLDYAVFRVGCRGRMQRFGVAPFNLGPPGDVFGWLRLRGWLPVVGDGVAVIAHPRGAPKRISVGAVRGLVFSCADTGAGQGGICIGHGDLTRPGSSGGPYLDENGYVYGIHNGRTIGALIPRTDIGRGPINFFGGTFLEESSVAIPMGAILDRSSTLQSVAESQAPRAARLEHVFAIAALPWTAPLGAPPRASNSGWSLVYLGFPQGRNDSFRRVFHVGAVVPYRGYERYANYAGQYTSLGRIVPPLVEGDSYSDLRHGDLFSLSGAPGRSYGIRCTER